MTTAMMTNQRGPMVLADRVAVMPPIVAALPALAEEGMGNTMDQNQQGPKNECLLYARNCADQVDSIQQRIDRLRGEIARGSDVYTKDELRRLNKQLDDAIRILEAESFGG